MDKPLEYGMRDYPLSLAAGVPKRLDVEGDYFHLIEAADDVQLSFDDGSWITRRVAMGMPVRTYRKVLLKSAVDQAVVVALGFTGGGTTPIDGRASIAGDINVFSNLPTQQPSLPDVTVPAGALVLVAAADPDRVSLTVQLDESAAGPIRTGDSAIGVARGIKLQPDDAYIFEGGAAIYVFNPNASDVVVQLSEGTAP